MKPSATISSPCTMTAPNGPPPPASIISSDSAIARRMNSGLSARALSAQAQSTDPQPASSCSATSRRVSGRVASWSCSNCAATETAISAGPCRRHRAGRSGRSGGRSLARSVPARARRCGEAGALGVRTDQRRRRQIVARAARRRQSRNRADGRASSPARGCRPAARRPAPPGRPPRAAARWRGSVAGKASAADRSSRPGRADRPAASPARCRHGRRRTAPPPCDGGGSARTARVTCAAAALAERRPEREVAHRRSAGAGGQHARADRRRTGIQIAAADRAGHGRRPKRPSSQPASRGVEPLAASTVTSTAGSPAALQRRQRVEPAASFRRPRRRDRLPARNASIASSTRSGVAGASRRGRSRPSRGRGDRVAQRVEHRDRPASAAARRRPWSGRSRLSRLRAAANRRDVERRRHVAAGRDLVGRGRVRAQPALVVPPQLLGGQPAHALDEAALDLAEVDRRVQRVRRNRAGCRRGGSRYSPVSVSTSTSDTAAP